MEWFKHDSDAHMDAKLRKLRIKYGMEGYGLYWYCLELIAKDVKATNITFELEHDSEIISHDTGINYKVVEEMITFMVDLQLFENSNGIVTCMKMAKRLDQSMTGNAKMREMIAKIKGGHDHIMTHHDDIMINHDSVMQEEKRREEKRIGENRRRFVPPTQAEVSKYCQDRGNGVDAGKFVDFYESKGWVVGKTKMKDWRAAVRTWEKTDKPKSHDGTGYTGVEI